VKKAILVLATASLIFGGTAASAAPYGDRDRDGIPNVRDPNPNNPRNPAMRRDRDRDGVPNAFDRRDNRRPRWARGQRFDRRYMGSHYVVNDWRRHGWRAPPRGYSYYRTDSGDVVLAAIATGLIASVIANAN
jgi:Ni/Co efflux regulator RcnB